MNALAWNAQWYVAKAGTATGKRQIGKACFPRWALGMPLEEGGINALRSARPACMPTVLSLAETRALLAAQVDPARLVCELLYGSGLRLLEALHLRVKDVDAQRLEITIRNDKGGKDRVETQLDFFTL